MQQLKIRHMWKIYGRTALEPKEDPFFQYYFTNCYEPENTMVGWNKDQLLSTVHLRQYNLNVRGAVLPTSYMVGVATHPAARRGGVGGAIVNCCTRRASQPRSSFDDFDAIQGSILPTIWLGTLCSSMGEHHVARRLAPYDG